MREVATRVEVTAIVTVDLPEHEVWRIVDPDVELGEDAEFPESTEDAVADAVRGNLGAYLNYAVDLPEVEVEVEP